MGTGSFGGGSGGFGSGGSGGSASSGGGSARNSAGGGRQRGDSVFKRILALLKLTRDISEHPKVEEARAAVIAALETPVRRRYLLEVLGDDLVNGIYHDLLELQALVTNGFDWALVARRYGLDEERASLGKLGTAIVARHQSNAVDERFVEIARGAVRDLLLEAVAEEPSVYFETRPRDLERNFDTKVLDSTAARFIAGILYEVIRRDVLKMTGEVKAMLGDVFLEIADRWCKIFEEKFRDRGNARYRDLLAVIARESPTFPVGE
jgi:hypothetical protein